MKEVIEKLERILALTDTHGICVNATGKIAESESELEYVESKIRLNAIQALSAFDALRIDLIEKPRTKVEYVKCEFEHAWEALKSFEEGEELYRDKNQTLQTEVVEFVKAASVGGIGYILTYYKADNLHRRIETPMTEREAFVDGYEKLVDGFIGDETKNADDWAGYVFDKLVS